MICVQGRNAFAIVKGKRLKEIKEDKFKSAWGRERFLYVIIFDRY